MQRLTTDNPSGNFETMLNFVYGKDGWAYIRSDGEDTDVLLSKWAAEQCISRDECEDIFQDGVLPEEIDTTICDCMMDFPDCPIALAYCFAAQAVHMRSRLKMYEDILFAEDGTELASLDDLRELIKARDNPPLTLEELREMDGEPVWIERRDGGANGWAIFGDVQSPYGVYFGTARGGLRLPYDDYGDTWLAYRRKTEEGTT